MRSKLLLAAVAAFLAAAAPASAITYGEPDGNRHPEVGALLLAGGAKGKRMALPNAKILIHQVSSGFQGQATDIEIHAKEIIDIRQRLDHIIAKHTKQDYDKVRNDTERDYFMSSEEAKNYGIIDRVISEH